MRENVDAFPRCWIAQEVIRLPALHTQEPAAVERRTEEVFYPAGRPRDFRRVAVVEGERSPPSNGDALDGQIVRWGRPAGTCRVLHWDPARWEIETRLTAPALMVINDLYAPGWSAFLE